MHVEILGDRDLGRGKKRYRSRIPAARESQGYTNGTTRPVARPALKTCSS
jgi:hypothetical protein